MPRTGYSCVALSLAAALMVAALLPATAGAQTKEKGWGAQGDRSVQLGPRPHFLVNRMDDGALKTRLEQCAAGPFSPSDFSIGHRGAPLQFPEHTRESYEAAARWVRASLNAT